MSREERGLFDSLGDATSGAGSEALAAISNLGGGDAGGTVGRLVSAVAGKRGGFAPKVITSVTKHGIAGIARVEPLSGVDRGYRAVAEDANGLESIRTIIELDPREYDVTVTREEGAGVVEFVQAPEPEPEPDDAVELSPPVKRAAADGVERAGGQPPARAGESTAGAPSVEDAPVRAGESAAHLDGPVARAKAEAEKARAEAEAEKARAEAETARAEAEAAKARAHAERARAEAETEAIGAGRDGTPELDGGADAAEDRSVASTAAPRAADAGGTQHLDPGDVDPAFSAPAGAPAADEPAGTVDDPRPPLRIERPEETETASDEADAGGATATEADDEFGGFVAASPVDSPATDGETADGGGTDEDGERTDGDGGSVATGGEGDELPAETGGFEF